MFKELNEKFICVNCGANVDLHPTSSRDHCNQCLYGLHVDINPGDRANDCCGVLIPIGLRQRNGKSQIVYRCSSCGAVTYCVVAPDDNDERLLELSAMVY